MHSGYCASVHKIHDGICHFGEVRLRQIFLIHHGPSYLEYVAIFPFGYPMLLRCMSTSEFSPNSFFLEICGKCIRKVLFSSAQPKASNMPACFLFDTFLELIEVCKHLVLVAHWINPSVCGVAINERNVISASMEGCTVCASPHTF